MEIQLDYCSSQSKRTMSPFEKRLAGFLLLFSIVIAVGCVLWGRVSLNKFQAREQREILTGTTAEQYYEFWSGEIQCCIGVVLELLVAAVVVHGVGARRWPPRLLLILLLNVVACAALLCNWFALGCEAFP